ncbi:hypothetical protein DL765_003514 [Monosporascus sp. GIB2]|nr:hypothetical protein DL765_003514 [Monosporascus sp. GIB2]
MAIPLAPFPSLHPTPLCKRNHHARRRISVRYILISHMPPQPQSYAADRAKVAKPPPGTMPRPRRVYNAAKTAIKSTSSGYHTTAIFTAELSS